MQLIGYPLGIEAAHRLARLGFVDIEPGLTDAEIAEVERTHGFEFANDHRAFLAEGLPVWTAGHDDSPYKASWGWPNWRENTETLRNQVAHPEAAILHEISRGHWPSGWGKTPADPELAVTKARSRLASVPRMIPVYAHRYLPAGRDTSGNPVLSIHTLSDTIVYGLDLADYIDQEFRTPELDVPFWPDYI